MRFKRIMASIIDWGIILTIVGMLSAFLPSYKIFGIEILRSIPIPILAFYIVLKDLLFRNASLGKIMSGLRIVQFNNKKASVESVIMRNIVLLIPPVCWVEVYDVIKGKTKRHADIWFKTKVVTKAEYISENMYN